jgi:hypothetical protein
MSSIGVVLIFIGGFILISLLIPLLERFIDNYIKSMDYYASKIPDMPLRVVLAIGVVAILVVGISLMFFTDLVLIEVILISLFPIVILLEILLSYKDKKTSPKSF